jgi:Cu(I)/Ag(I) efflux system membrane fusion protein
MSFTFKRMDMRYVIPVVGFLAVVLAIVLLSSRAPQRAPTEPTLTTGGEAAETIWTCSMHPQIRQPRPGKCPICGMDLVPVEQEAVASGAEDARRLTVSQAAAKLMEIATSPVERRFADVEVPMVGKVAYDETRVSRIAAWVPGRIERLFVDYVGYAVKKGDPMAELYSPDLLAAQEELLQAGAAVRGAHDAGAAESAQATLDAVRERLSLWGLGDEQIADIERRGTAEPRTTIAAPSGGTVVEKNVTQGMYVETGMEIYTIADLSTVWITLDAYESDLTWVHVGQHAMFTVEGYPGETFHGEVSFIEPTVDPDTRTVNVRLEAPNPDGRLKPEMFVRATVAARQVGGHAALVVPASAPLLTGKRAVVYVEVPGTELPTYEGRDVVLGPRAGDYYVVVSGLREGERVVTEGNFKIDSALEIRAKPSMMNPEGGTVAPTGHEGHGGATTGHEGH